MAKDSFEFSVSLPRPRFSIAALLGLMAFCVVCLAWYLDRERLRLQIPVPERKQMLTFRLFNASPEVVAAELQKLYPNDVFVSELGSNSVITSFAGNNADALSLIVRHMDRKGTEYLKINADPETHQLVPAQIATVKGGNK